MQLVDSVAGASIEVVRVDADPAIRDSDCPEEATRRDAGADVVCLVRVGCQGINLTLIEVESYESESSVVLLSIHADVLPAHEPVVAVEEQWRRFVGLRIPPVPRTAATPVVPP
jgi:hypothetical protein